MDKFRAQRGLTLIEALLALFVGTLALLGLYQLVDTSNRITKQQTEVADVQQSARIGVAELSRIIRQSRIGGLYYGNAVLPIANNGTPLTNANVVSFGGLVTPMTDLQGKPHAIRAGTDAIEVRGVIFGEKYVLDEGDAICSGPCNTTTKISVTIPSRAGPACDPVSLTGCFVNFPSGTKPSLALKTRPFYFVVQIGENQQVNVNGSNVNGPTYLVPNYVAGLVDPASFDSTSDTFTLEMNPQDLNAQRLNATTTLPSSVGKSISGGAVDVVRFFVDDDVGGTHPSLAEAVYDPKNGQWDVQTLIEEVEDFQVAYGVDGANCPTNPACYDGGVDPVAVDQKVSNNDEWVGNVPLAFEVENTLTISAPTDPCLTAPAVPCPSGVGAFINTTVPSGQPAVPALRSVWVSLVVKSADPDLVFDGPGARGIQILDSTAVSFSASTGRPYRRRPLSLAVSLRNNGLSNK